MILHMIDHSEKVLYIRIAWLKIWRVRESVIETGE